MNLERSRAKLHCSEDRRFRYGGAVSTRVGSAIVDARCGIAHDRLPWTKLVRVVGAEVQLMAARCKLLPDIGRYTLLDLDFATARFRIPESRGIERRLDI